MYDPKDFSVIGEFKLLANLMIAASSSMGRVSRCDWRQTKPRLLLYWMLGTIARVFRPAHNSTIC